MTRSYDWENVWTDGSGPDLSVSGDGENIWRPGPGALLEGLWIPHSSTSDGVDARNKMMNGLYNSGNFDRGSTQNMQA